MHRVSEWGMHKDLRVDIAKKKSPKMVRVTLNMKLEHKTKDTVKLEVFLQCLGNISNKITLYWLFLAMAKHTRNVPECKTNVM